MKDPEDTVTYELPLEPPCETTNKSTRPNFHEESMRRGWKGREQEGSWTPRGYPEPEKT